MLIRTTQGSLSLVAGYAWVHSVRCVTHPWDPPHGSARANEQSRRRGQPATSPRYGVKASAAEP